MEIDAIIIKEKTISEKSRLHLRTSSQTTSEREMAPGESSNGEVANLSRSLCDNLVQGNLLVGSQRGKLHGSGRRKMILNASIPNAAREAGNNRDITMESA
jgi:hypothetical protein